MTDMMQHESTSRNFLTRWWHQTGLRIRLTIGAVLVSVLVAGALFVSVRSLTIETTAFILDQFGALSLEQAENQLTSLVTEESQSFDRYFSAVTEDLIISSNYVTTLFAQKDVFGQGEYWDAREEIVRLDEGQWGNSPDDPASFLAPASFELTDETAAIVNTGMMADYVLPHVLETNPNLLAIYYIDQTGATFYYPNIDLANIVGDFDPRERPYYQAFITNSTETQPFFWSEAYTDAALNGLVSTNSVPVFSPTGEFTGVLAADLLIKTITDRVSEFRIRETGYAFLIDNNGRYIAVPEIAYADLGITAADITEEGGLSKTSLDAPDNLKPILNEMIAGGQGVQTINSNDIEKFVAYAPVAASGYSLGVVVPVDQMRQAYLSTRQQADQADAASRQAISLTFIGILFVSAIFGYGMSLYLTHPIEALTKVAEEVAAGNLEARADPQMGGEMGILARTFNDTTSRIQELVTGLEERVADRTRALEASTEVSRRLSTLLDPQQLVAEVVQRVQQAFDYYHVHIYILDEPTRDLVMVGGTGEAGQSLLNKGHRLAWGKGLVGRCAATNEVVLVSDVSQVENWLPNPYLPDTKTEIAVPIAIGEQMLGVLDVQDVAVGALTDEDIHLLQSVANQVAVALRNARLYEQVQLRAENEAVVNRISQQILDAPDIERVLQITAQELGRTLKAKNTTVQLSVKHKSVENGRTRGEKI